ncbi:hypothetical protein ACLKA7_007452 [Drosophila subpalustris]
MALASGIRHRALACRLSLSTTRVLAPLSFLLCPLAHMHLPHRSCTRSRSVNGVLFLVLVLSLGLRCRQHFPLISGTHSNSNAAPTRLSLKDEG